MVSKFLPVDGIRLCTACAGIKRTDRDDLAVMALEPGAVCAAVFTRNAFCAAPVEVARRHLSQTAPRYLLVNSGNANAGTGAAGLADAEAACASLAAIGACEAEQVLPFSTGVIGQPLPVEKISRALPRAFENLSAQGWEAAARAIMTTDTVPKLCTTTLDIDGAAVTVTGMAKGAGMIRPDMATMLAFVATDAPLSRAAADRCLRSAVDSSFNRITVDGDTSTNDACVLVASGRAPTSAIEGADDRRYPVVQQAVAEVCRSLAQAIVRDGEGATKFITVLVEGGRSEQECLQVAYTVAQSPLVKTAFFASDPNWGRILAAVGRAGVPDLDISGVTIHLDDVCIVRNGGPANDYTEARGQKVMSGRDITVRVDLARGRASGEVWTCDFSYDYVRINAEYRT